MAQQLAGQVLPEGSAQLVGAAVNGLQQGNLGQAMAQQLAGQVLPEGSAQLVGAAVNGLQQGNLAQAAVQALAPQLAAGGAAQSVLVLRVPANLMNDANGSAIMRVVQPGETLARLNAAAQAGMFQVRDSNGAIGWIAADTIADVINTQ